MLNEESETFMVYVVALKGLLIRMTIHLLQAAHIAALKQDQAPIKVPPKYTDYSDVFFFDMAMELSKNTSINKDAIELQDGKQPPYMLIYSLRQVELKTLKTYIETHLITRFI